MSLEVLQRRLAREQKARRSAEKLLEQKALELYLANEQLKGLNENLQAEVLRTTAEIEAQKLRLSIILESLREGLLVEDQYRKITLVNQAFCDLFKIPMHPQALIGMDCAQNVEQSKNLFKDPKHFISTINKMLEGRIFFGPETLETLDGRFLELSYIPIQNEDTYIGHLWRYQDITEQFLIDKRIRESEEKYRSIMENMELGLMEVNPKGVITRTYDRFCKMTGYTAEELIGKNAAEVFLPDEYIPMMEEQDQQRKVGKSGAYEIQLKTKDRGLIWVIISGAPFFDDQANLQGSIGIHYDITKQKELQKELELARNEAEKARDAEKKFLANMSHEIRNPINSIIGMTNLLYDTAPNPEQLEYLQHVGHSSELLLELISDILDVSKIIEGQIDIKAEPFFPKEFFSILEKTIAFRLHDKEVKFSLAIPKDLPEVLLGDTKILNQILLNLLGNAIKFTPEGSVSLNIQQTKETQSSISLLFTVKDTGIGIPTDKLDHIFNRFGQVGQATKYEGTGLGLPIAKELIELNGGTIKVESQEGEGTSFYFDLTFQKSGQTQLSVKMPTALSSDKLRGLCLKVLIVEDNNTNRFYLEQLLKKWGHNYQSCADGKEALELLEKEVYDLILMDIRMPVLDGYETTIRLRSSIQNPNAKVPIIALTASALLDEKEKALTAGMNFHLTKPFTPEKLAKAIGQFYDKKGLVNSSEFNWPPPFNSHDLKEHYGTDMSYAQSMFIIFQKNIPSELQEMDRLIQEENWNLVAALAHKIKPNFGMVGLPHLLNQINAFEEVLQSEDLSESIVSDNWAQIKKEVEEVLPVVQVIIDQIN